MSESRDRRQADVLLPAGPKAIGRFLKDLPGFPGAGKLVLFVLVAAGTVTGMTLTSQVLGRVVDIIGGTDVPVLGGGDKALRLALILVAVGLAVELVGRVLITFMVNHGSRTTAVSLRKRALDSVIRTPVPTIMELGTGNVITRLSKDIDTPVMTLAMMGDRLMITAFIVPITAATMAFIHPAYLVLFVVIGAVMYPWIKTMARDIPAVTNVVSSVEAQRNNILLDTIRALDTLRLFTLGGWARQRMTSYSWDTVQAWADKIPLFNRVLSQGSTAFGMLLLGGLAMSKFMVDAGWLTVGEAAAVMLLIMRLEVHVFNLLLFAGDLQHAVTALGRAVALAQLGDAHSGTADPSVTVPPAPDVVITDVTFAYPGGAAVLDGIDLTLAGGTTTALVGTSGAGKSTLAALVAGLQYPTSGSIVVGGVDTATVPNSWVTQHVALVTQDVHLFSGSLRDDLLLAAPGASDTVLLAALQEVGLAPGTDAWDRWLPDGLDTLVGAGNEDVGPEVAQQISLARMVLRQPPVLIMDEATSEAGSEHAVVLERAARAVTKGRTALVVAHRLDQAREADRIIVMEAGQIVEDGDHDSLIARGGRYARSYAQWASGQG